MHRGYIAMESTRVHRSLEKLGVTGNVEVAEDSGVTRDTGVTESQEASEFRGHWRHRSAGVSGGIRLQGSLEAQECRGSLSDSQAFKAVSES